MRHRFFAHLVWATLNREPILTLAAARFLEGYFGRIAQDERGELIQFGAVRTHVHVLVRFHPAVPITRLVQRLKGGSAFLGRRDHDLAIRWHPGYSGDAIPTRGLLETATYVAEQHRRHPTEAIEGWPDDPAQSQLRARERVQRMMELLDRENYGHANRRSHGGS
jgi:putative transposase